MLTIADRSFTIRRVTRPRRAANDAAFQDLRERWLASQVSANTRAAYAIDLTKFGQWCASQRTMPLVVDAQTIATFQAAQANWRATLLASVSVPNSPRASPARR